jgi:hypothetical protein
MIKKASERFSGAFLIGVDLVATEKGEYYMVNQFSTFLSPQHQRHDAGLKFDIWLDLFYNMRIAQFSA